MRPSDSILSSCPSRPCPSLEQYAEMSNFTKGTIFIFLPGDHDLLRSSLNLVNASNITLKGETSVRIIISNPATIQCQNITHLKIEGLVFLLNDTAQQVSAINLIHCSDTILLHTLFRKIENGSIVSSKALHLSHSEVTVTNCVFEDITGTAIHVLGGSNLTISGSSFSRNRGMGDGGTICAWRSHVLLDGSPLNTFSHNMDRNWGGAIYCSLCKLEITGHNTFNNHSALYARHSFAPSSGGTFYVNQGELIISGTLLVSSSTAHLGGAIHMLHYSKALIKTGTKIVFRENSAKEDGGALKIQGSTFISQSIDLSFINNTANTGGAVQIDNYQDIYESKEKEVVVLSGYFSSNKAYFAGGVVHADSAQITFLDVHMTDNFMNAMTVSRSNVTFRGAATISNHHEGGMTLDDCVTTFEKSSIFSNNRNPYGGAINLLQGTTACCF